MNLEWTHEAYKWHAFELLGRFKCESEVKTLEEQGVKAHSLTHSILGVEGHVRAPGWDYEEW
jgi:hypothetical protein